MPSQGARSAPYSQHPCPLPDLAFINSNRPTQRPQPLTTATKEGKATARKRKAPPAKKTGEKAQKKASSAAKKAGQDPEKKAKSANKS